jgi:asparagine synthase (glutamine-hydrolysing)
MCGIAGLIATQSAIEMRRLAQKMADTLVHRGPDDADVWVDEAAGIALAHRRLAILDLSPAGHQPMTSACGRYVVVFNGEIYNHLELRRELEKRLPVKSHHDLINPLLQLDTPKWRGHSDTETLLAAVACWGIENTLKRLVGMFAFALWDRSEATLYMARDRLGEKPLYYGWQHGVFLFGSELKALRAHPAFSAEIDRQALTLLLRHNYIPTPYSIYQGIYKLPPGTWVTIRHRQREVVPLVYWSAREIAEQGQQQPFTGSNDEAVTELEQLLSQSITGQMLADVPLGAFLSGGVDSSTVVALMQAHSGHSARTFTIGFFEAAYNEAEHAASVAHHLRTEHTELYVTPEQAQAVIPRLPVLYDEPFADSSQIPTFLVSQLARQQVTVSLSGDGGDELFSGYNRYTWAVELWRKLARIPIPLRTAVAGLLTALPPTVWNQIFVVIARFLPAQWRYANPGDKLHKLAEVLAVKCPEEIYLELVSHWKNPTAVVIGAQEPQTVLTDSKRWAELPNFEHGMMYLDLVSYLPDDILVKVDRAAMGVSLETRVPLLDHRLVEFAWRLPLAMKLHDGQSKWLLRQVLYRHIPRELIERPKMGFGIPLDVWLRGPLKKWADELLDAERLRREGFFNPVPIREKWIEHLSGKRNWAYYLWDVIVFQAWFEHTHVN